MVITGVTCSPFDKIRGKLPGFFREWDIERASSQIFDLVSDIKLAEETFNLRFL